MSIHGGKAQEERNEAIDFFKAGTKDVLVATDVAAKGLDFPDIQVCAGRMRAHQRPLVPSAVAALSCPQWEARFRMYLVAIPLRHWSAWRSTKSFPSFSDVL